MPIDLRGAKPANATPPPGEPVATSLIGVAQELLARLNQIGGRIEENGALELAVIEHNRKVLALAQADFAAMPSAQLPYVARNAKGEWTAGEWLATDRGLVTADGLYERRRDAVTCVGVVSRVHRTAKPALAAVGPDAVASRGGRGNKAPKTSAIFRRFGFRLVCHVSTPSGLRGILTSGALKAPSAHRRPPVNVDGIGFASQQNGDFIFCGAVADRHLGQVLEPWTVLFDVELLDTQRYHVSTSMGRGRPLDLDPATRQGSARGEEPGRLEVVLGWMAGDNDAQQTSNEIVFRKRVVPLRHVAAVLVPAAEKAAMIAELKAQGIATIAGRPVAELVVTPEELRAVLVGSQASRGQGPAPSSTR